MKQESAGTGLAAPGPRTVTCHFTPPIAPSAITPVLLGQAARRLGRPAGGPSVTTGSLPGRWAARALGARSPGAAARRCSWPAPGTRRRPRRRRARRPAARRGGGCGSGGRRAWPARPAPRRTSPCAAPGPGLLAAHSPQAPFHDVLVARPSRHGGGLAQRGERAGRLALDRADRAVERRRGLRLRQVEPVAEHDHGALARAEGAQRVEQRLLLLWPLLPARRCRPRCPPGRRAVPRPPGACGTGCGAR